MRIVVRPALPALLLLLPTILSGCVPRDWVHQVDPDVRYARENRSILNSSAASDRTMHYLRSEGLLDDWETRPQEILVTLSERLRTRYDRTLAYHLCELLLTMAESEDAEPELRFSFSIATAGHAWAWLFEAPTADPRNAFDPEYAKLREGMPKEFPL